MSEVRERAWNLILFPNAISPQLFGVFQIVKTFLPHQSCVRLIEKEDHSFTWKSLSLVCLCLCSLPLKKFYARGSKRVFFFFLTFSVVLFTYIHSSVLNTGGKSTGFERNSQSCDMFFSLACANYVSSEIVHLSNGKHIFHFETCMVNNMSIKRGRNIAVVKGSVVNALEVEIPRPTLLDRLNELRTEISGCIIVQLSSNAFL